MPVETEYLPVPSKSSDTEIFVSVVLRVTLAMRPDKRSWGLEFVMARYLAETPAKTQARPARFCDRFAAVAAGNRLPRAFPDRVRRKGEKRPRSQPSI